MPRTRTRMAASPAGAAAGSPRPPRVSPPQSGFVADHLIGDPLEPSRSTGTRGVHLVLDAEDPVLDDDRRAGFVGCLPQLLDGPGPDPARCDQPFDLLPLIILGQRLLAGLGRFLEHLQLFEVVRRLDVRRAARPEPGDPSTLGGPRSARGPAVIGWEKHLQSLLLGQGRQRRDLRDRLELLEGIQERIRCGPPGRARGGLRSPAHLRVRPRRPARHRARRRSRPASSVSAGPSASARLLQDFGHRNAELGRHSGDLFLGGRGVSSAGCSSSSSSSTSVASSTSATSSASATSSTSAASSASAILFGPLRPPRRRRPSRLPRLPPPP